VNYKTIDETIGNTPLVKLQRLNPNPSNTILLKLEGNNPAGSVKDRAAFNMITQAEARGEITPKDVLIEATSGNTGIALAMVAAIKGYTIILIMPDNLSQERRDAMAAYGADLILVTEEQGMEGARDLADKMEKASAKENSSINFPIKTTPMPISTQPQKRYGKTPMVKLLISFQPWVLLVLSWEFLLA